jgi:predicted nucleic acid-binding protein
MLKVVIDSSVAIKWLITESYSPQAEQILQHYQSGDIEMLVPELIYAEVGNVIWKKHEFQGLGGEDARAVMLSFLHLPLNVVPTQQLLIDAFQLAITYRRTVYDSLYLALSQREQCEFITADEKLVHAVQRVLPDTIWLPDWKFTPGSS